MIAVLVHKIAGVAQKICLCLNLFEPLNSKTDHSTIFARNVSQHACGTNFWKHNWWVEYQSRNQSTPQINITYVSAVIHDPSGFAFLSFEAMGSHWSWKLGSIGGRLIFHWIHTVDGSELRWSPDLGCIKKTLNNQRDELPINLSTGAGFPRYTFCRLIPWSSRNRFSTCMMTANIDVQWWFFGK